MISHSLEVAHAKGFWDGGVLKFGSLCFRGGMFKVYAQIPRFLNAAFVLPFLTGS